MNIIDLILYDMLTESKQVGELYHFTKLKGLTNILKTDKIYKSQENDFGDGVSTTRDKLLWFNEVRIGLNGDKLSQKYKIKPVNWYNDVNMKRESEERILARQIDNAYDYITSITINMNDDIIDDSYVYEFYKYVEWNFSEILKGIDEYTIFNKYDNKQSIQIILKKLFPHIVIDFVNEQNSYSHKYHAKSNIGYNND